MQSISALYFKLSSVLSDADVAIALKDYFSEIGDVSSANRFPIRGESGKRCYVILFKSPLAAINAANRYKLHQYAFNGVLVKLDMPRYQLRD